MKYTCEAWYGQKVLVTIRCVASSICLCRHTAGQIAPWSIQSKRETDKYKLRLPWFSTGAAARKVRRPVCHQQSKPVWPALCCRARRDRIRRRRVRPVLETPLESAERMLLYFSKHLPLLHSSWSHGLTQRHNVGWEVLATALHTYRFRVVFIL